MEILQFLVEKGIDVNAKDKRNRTALHVAVQQGSTRFYDTLVALQADDQWVQEMGTGLLEISIMEQHLEIIKRLTKAGVNLNSRNDRGSHMLELAQRMKSPEIFDYLVLSGADSTLMNTYKMKGPYMGQADPRLVRQLFAPHFISTEESEFGSVFSTDGTEFYYGVDVGNRNEIRYSRLENGVWTIPEKIIYDDSYGYNDPFLSNDEKRLYYISDRALDGKGGRKDIDIWYSEKTEEGWSEPINAGEKINSDKNEYYISFTQDGTMCFSSNANAQENNNSDYDIYLSRHEDGKFQEPVPLPDEVNTTSYEADVFIAPDQSYIIFCSTREGGYGQGDLYISFKNKEGEWTPATNMGPEVNSEFYEYCPFVTKDGKLLLFTSNQDIYFISSEIFKN